MRVICEVAVGKPDKTWVRDIFEFDISDGNNCFCGDDRLSN